MKYLSDDLIVRIPTEGYTGKYMSYILQAVFHDYDATATVTDLYRGRIYLTGTQQTLNVKEIMETSGYNHHYLSPNAIRMARLDKLDEFVEHPKNVLRDIQIYFVEIDKTVVISDLFNYHKDKRIQRGEGFGINTSPNPLIYNMLTERTKILPRVPLLPFVTDKFFFGAALLVNQAAKVEGNDKYNINSYRQIGLRPQLVNGLQYECLNCINCHTITGRKYYNLCHGSLLPANYISAVTGSTKTLLARIEECPADYYLIWIDRTGAYQCQPFAKRTVMNEDIKTSTLSDIDNFNRPYEREVTNTWNINSDWLTYDEYKAYESIFVSPYVYIYDTKYDEGTFVNCVEKVWSERTKENNKRMFNLNLKVTSSLSDNILS